MITRLIVFILTFMFLAGCDNQPETTGENKQDDVFHLRFGHDMPVGSAHHLAAIRFADIVKQKSQGRVEITVFPAQELGTDHEMIKMAQEGTLDIILPPTAKLSPIVPSIQIIDIPFLFNDNTQAYEIMDGDLGRALLDKLKSHNLYGAAFWESGFKHFTANKPIVNAEDLINTRFRIMRSNLLRDQFKTWGANIMVVDFAKTRDALKDLVVDGQENPLGSIYNMGFHEVQSHLILSAHGYLAQVLSFSKISIDRLPKYLQEILFNTAREVTSYQRQESIRLNSEYLEKIKQSNIKIIPLSNETRSILKKKSDSLFEMNRTSMDTRIVETMLQALDNNRQFADNELVIGLDADMAGNSAQSGLAIRRGIEMAIREINATGGILNKKLVLTARDNSMVSARGKQNIEHFSRIPQLVAVFGGISSPVALSEISMIHEKKILYLDPWAAATNIVDNGNTPNYVFRVSVRDADAAGYLIPQALKISNKIALLLVNNGWGRSNYDGMIQALKHRNTSPMSVEWFDWGDQNIHKKINRIYASGANVIVFVGNVVEGSNVIRDLAMRDTPLPVISHWGITGGEFVKLSGNALNKVDLKVLQTFSFINKNDKKTQDFIRKYKADYHVNSEREIIAPTGTAHAYDLTHLLAMAIKSANSTDMPKIRDAMENLGSYNGLIKNYNPAFTQNNHDALGSASFSLSRYDNGVLTPILNK